MRRPLFDSGLPKNLNPADSVVALSLTDKPALQGRTVGLTLWAISELGTTLRPTVNNFDIADSVILGESVLPTNGSVKLLDRYPMRGNVDMVVENVGANPGFLFGYYQVEGERIPPLEFRPVQPSLTSVASSYSPANATLGGAVVVHAFSIQYIDNVRLRSFATPPGILVVCDGVSTVSIPAGVGVDGGPLLVFEGIPFRALANTPVGGFAPGIHAVADASGSINAWGMFTRG